MSGDRSVMRFIADEQLGKLSRWLKILGQDVIYQNRIDDKALLKRARVEARVILTRDSRLAQKAEGLPLYRVRENYPALQLREVVERFQEQMRIDLFSRCVECNAQLHNVSKEEVAGKVPPFVYQTQENFRQCPVCGKYFWSATHREHIEFLLQEILGELYQRLSG